MAKDKKKKDEDGAKKKGAAPAAYTLSAHPKAQRHIRQAKGWGGLAAFAICAYLSHGAGVPLADLLWRSVLAGVAGVLVCWGGAVFVWSHVATAELEVARRNLIAGIEAVEAERKRRAEAAAAGTAERA